jgi:hypothetical protein
MVFFFPLCTFSFEKALFSLIAHFFIGSLIWGKFFFELPINY